MIRGEVNARLEAVLPIRVRAPEGTEVEVDAVIDTGFSASLTLPATLVDQLGLRQEARARAVLGDGSTRLYGLYGAEVQWLGDWKKVLASGLGVEVLVGMKLMAEHRVTITVISGGRVEIDKAG